MLHLKWIVCLVLVCGWTAGALAQEGFKPLFDGKTRRP